jgi:hypothetical protein
MNATNYLPTFTKNQFEELQNSPQKENQQNAMLKISKGLVNDIRQNECLFCEKAFDSVDVVFVHMTSHNFRFSYLSRLIDQSGLLKYIAKQIEIRHFCIFWHRHFWSLRAVRNHMIDLYHCLYELNE